MDGVNINGGIDEGGGKELSFRCGFDAAVAPVLEKGVGEVLVCLFRECCSPKSVWHLPWPSSGGWWQCLLLHRFWLLWGTPSPFLKNFSKRYQMIAPLKEIKQKSVPIAVVHGVEGPTYTEVTDAAFPSCVDSVVKVLLCCQIFDFGGDPAMRASASPACMF